MSIIPLNFAKQAYQNRSLPVSAQRLVNLYCERVSPEDSKTSEVIYGAAGLNLFKDLGIDAPIYGMHSFNDLVYIVVGDYVYTMSGSGTLTYLGSIATVTGNCQMLNNGLEVAILKPDGSLYKATTTAVTQITDADLPTVGSITYLDSFLFYNEVDSNLFGASASNDISDYDSLDTSNAESDSDKIVRVFGDLGELWLMGGRTIEIWYNNGDTSGVFPYQRVAGGGNVIKRGCAAKLSVIQESNSVIWLGDDLMFYMAQGYTPSPISTVAIAEALRKYTTVSDAIAFIYTEAGHKFYVITFPTQGATWVYDMTTQLWHERESFGLTRWRANNFVNAFGKNLVGDFETGKIYEISLDAYTENGQYIRREAVTPHGFDRDVRIIYNYFQIDFESGVGLNTGQGLNPSCRISISKNGGRQFSNWYQKYLGKVGEYLWRTILRRIGQARTMCFKVEISEPIKIAIAGAYADIEVCDS